MSHAMEEYCAFITRLDGQKIVLSKVSCQVTIFNDISDVRNENMEIYYEYLTFLLFFHLCFFCLSKYPVNLQLKFDFNSQGTQSWSEKSLCEFTQIKYSEPCQAHLKLWLARLLNVWILQFSFILFGSAWYGLLYTAFHYCDDMCQIQLR